MGKKHRFGYFAIGTKNFHPEDKVYRESAMFNGFMKYDFDTHQVKTVNYPDEMTAGEVGFYPRDESKAEDDGYLMTFLYSYKSNCSQFAMWDAQTLKPVVRMQLKDRVPHGFHGLFVQEEELEQ